MSAPRPVTPLGILAAELDALAGELDAVALDDRVRARLHRARDLATGLDPYLERCTTPESHALAALAERTRAQDWAAHGPGALEQEMLSGHVEGQALKMLVHACRARRVLEIGMFTGYSALAMAEALPADGVVVACELDAGVAAIARECFALSPAGGRIEVRVGPADTTLKELAAADEAFDLVFLDADKPGYLGYVNAVLDGGLLAPHGLLCVDNTLMQGRPWLDGDTGDRAAANGVAVATFNAALAADPRVEQVLLPLRDGLTLARRTGRPTDRP
jgi:caffeoyl-CoA O-methyltransferase